MGNISVHRLVQETVRLTLEKEDQEQKILSGVVAVLLSKIEVDVAGNPLLPHLRAASKFLDVGEESYPNRSARILQLRCREMEAASLLAERRLFKACEIQEECLEGFKSVLDSKAHDLVRHII